MATDSNPPLEDRPIRQAVTESQRILDKQHEMLQELDDKAMRTVRTAVLILGFVVSAGVVGGVEAIEALSIVSRYMAAFGVLLTFGAAFVGTGMYTLSRTSFGISRERRMGAQSETAGRWNRELLHRYDELISEMETEIEGNGLFLGICNVLLLAGSWLLVLAAASEIAEKLYNQSPWLPPLAFLALGVVAIGIAQGLMRWNL